MQRDPTKRFSDRVENYVRYRPGYPPETLDILAKETGLTADSTVADVGAGTGISTDLLLRTGCTVFAVEPNREMRQAAERLLSDRPGFRSVESTAEATTLPDRSVSHVTAAQAFHWFDPGKARLEFSRILQPDGWVVLLWNARKLDATPFLASYESLLKKFARDYEQIRHENIDDGKLREFFKGGRYEHRVLPNAQSFDYEGLKGRLLSSSYAPAEGHPNHEPMLLALEELFARHQQGGRVSFDYDTGIYFGRVAA